MHRAFLLLLSFAALLVSCASTGTSAPAGPAQVTYRQYASGVRFTIVNESHTDRLEKYSTVGGDASVKVATDEVMAELLALEDRLELPTQAGPAPKEASTSALSSFEIQDGRGLRHAILASGADRKTKEAFAEYQLSFIALFNNIYAPQAVEADPGIFNTRR